MEEVERITLGEINKHLDYWRRYAKGRVTKETAKNWLEYFIELSAGFSALNYELSSYLQQHNS